MPAVVKRPLVELIMRERGISRATAYVEVKAVRLPLPTPSNNTHHRRVRDQQLALIEAHLGRPLRRLAIVATVLLALAVSATAQTVTPPSTLAVVWDPPTDPSTGLVGYVEYYVVKLGSAPGATSSTVRVEDGREYRFTPADRSKVEYFRVSACSLARVDGKDVESCSPDSNEANTSAFVVTEPPVDACAGAVVVAVGDWTRTATSGDSAQVFWSLGRSKQPITAVTVYLDGVPAPSTPDNPNPKTGDDLRGFTGSRFKVPPGSGTVNVSVGAESAGGCKSVADRLMPLVVR